MIQDIAPHQFDNAYYPVAPDRHCIALCYESRACLMKKTEEEFIFPRFADLENENEGIYKNYTFLFRIDEERYYLVTNVCYSHLKDYSMEDISYFRSAEPQYRAFAGITGHQLFGWYNSHRYCGACGLPMKPDSKERMIDRNSVV